MKRSPSLDVPSAVAPLGGAVSAAAPLSSFPPLGRKQEAVTVWLQVVTERQVRDTVPAVSSVIHVTELPL